ncbi:tmem9 [Homalodisca vitripennis]|nr:tmem9 [Homalodisca vitripennis]
MGAQSYEDARCKCVCTVVNGTQTYKKLYIANVPPNNDCDGVSVPVVDNDNKTQELCPRCECKYESRNTTIIKVVVIIVIWIISLLVIYMLFLICLDPLLNKRAKSSYVEHTNEDLLLRCRLYLVNRGVASSFHGPLQFREQEKVTGGQIWGIRWLRYH